MKTAHIISHTHWDREWYLPYESHHMRLIMLIDQILEAIETDPDFKSFHLDGQTICIDDYLQVKPQNRDKLLAAIETGKIKVGPWYILQDAFLTSAEANVRNGYYGNIDCNRYGEKTTVGYYPDTFGIYAQAPQLLTELEIDNMIFGRGVSTTGFNNEVSNDFESKFSEMKVTASNGSSVLGILFANWYSNGNEIPTDPAQAKQYWEQKLAECEKYTNCQNLLFMNGCDHTPYQSDVTQAIKVANELYPDIEFKQSSFAEYLEAVKSEIDEQNLTTISGELTSQTTDGLYTLVNTASSRINQKIENAKIQDMYQYLVEPLSALYSRQYMHAEIEYGWKKLMQNHPHDSICGCSVDSVHNTIDGRFEDSKNVGLHVINQTLTEIAGGASIDQENLGFTVFNPSEIGNSNHCLKIEYRRCEFGTDFRAARDQMKAVVIPELDLYDSSGNLITASITDLGIGFDYYLPAEKFRRPYYSRNIEVEFSYQFDFIGDATFYLRPRTENQQLSAATNLTQFGNDNLEITINSDGSFKLLNKTTNRSQDGLLKIYDQGDIGNEYMFGSVADDVPLYLTTIEKIEDYSTAAIQKRRVFGVLEIPASADSKLASEQLDIVEYNARQAKRSTTLINQPIVIDFELGKYDNGIGIKVAFENQAKDHRMRARFEFAGVSDEHYADTAFETVKRPNIPMDTWKNPNFDNRLAKFVKLQNQQDSLLIATNGLHEYEATRDYVDITLVRSVGELGDWGHFPTPEAQCLYAVTAELYVVFDQVEADQENQNKLRSIFVKQPFIQLPDNHQLQAGSHVRLALNHDPNSYISTIKKSLDDELIVRFGSNGAESKIETEYHLQKTNMLELKSEQLATPVVAANQILTVKVEK